MKRREMLAGLAASPLLGLTAAGAGVNNTYLELKTWRLENSDANQGRRVAEYLESGLGPALERAAAKLAGAFGNVYGPDGPYYVSLAQYASLGAMQDALAALAKDKEHRAALRKMDAGPGLPFVRVESSVLRSFDGFPQVHMSGKEGSGKPRIFELRTYESQTFETLERKIAMFNGGEMQIFERLGLRPVFFGETIVGPQQPNLKYMLSFDDIGARERLWQAFGSDPEWKKLSSDPALKDSEIVKNIGNAILRPLEFSGIR